MSLRAAFAAIVFGLVAALGMFFWTEYQTGRLPDLVREARSAANATPPALVTRPPPATATREPTATALAAATATATRAAVMASPTGAPTPSPLPSPRGRGSDGGTPTPSPGPTQLTVSRDELDAELKRQIAAGGLPLRNPAVTLVAPDRVLLRGDLPVAIFQVPVELEARLSVDDRGALRLQTTRVDAVGASLPQGAASALGQQIDDLGGRAVQAALPAGVVARRVTVQADRVVVDLAAPSG